MKHPAAAIIAKRDYPAQLIDTAREMIERRRFEVAVVTCQMACEICVERVFRTYFKAKSLEDLEEPIDDLLPSYNLANDKVRRLYSALTDDHVHREFFWSEYKVMVGIRNKAVHAGARVQESQAQMVLRIATSVVKHLSRVELLAGVNPLAPQKSENTQTTNELPKN